MDYGILKFKEPQNNIQRKIIHVDMDAFYASVEMRDNPKLKNKAVIIAHDPRTRGGRGVVATANYEARKFGVHSAMSAQIALEKCPQAIFISPRMNYYAEVSQKIRKVFQKYTDIIEPLSLDEAYLDVTENKINLTSATLLAMRIQKDVWDAVGLTCSAGVSYNKFLAKIASDIKKPGGLTVITPENAQDFLWELPITKFYGVGQKTAEKLMQLEIVNGKGLYELPAKFLVDEFGKMGFRLYQRVRGIDNNPVAVNKERKSVGKESTFGPFLVSEEQVLGALRELATSVHYSLEKNKVHGRIITLKIRYADFETTTRQKSFSSFIDGEQEIFWKAQDLWREHGEVDREVRLLGITLSHLAPQYYTNIQLPLWDNN